MTLCGPSGPRFTAPKSGCNSRCSHLLCLLHSCLPTSRRARAYATECKPNGQPLLHDLSFLRREMIRLGLTQSGEDHGLTDDAFEVFFAARQEVDLFEDAEAALQALSARWPILAVSNGNADVHRIGIGQYFCGSVSARDAGVVKPDVRIFTAASSALGCEPQSILHVGDDAAMDVLGALDAGMQTAWVNRNQHAWTHDVQPHATVSTMVELCTLLAL